MLLSAPCFGALPTFGMLSPPLLATRQVDGYALAGRCGNNAVAIKFIAPLARRTGVEATFYPEI